jgi:hypothetical protein
MVDTEVVSGFIVFLDKIGLFGVVIPFIIFLISAFVYLMVHYLTKKQTMLKAVVLSFIFSSIIAYFLIFLITLLSAISEGTAGILRLIAMLISIIILVIAIKKYNSKKK